MRDHRRGVTGSWTDIFPVEGRYILCKVRRDTERSYLTEVGGGFNLIRHDDATHLSGLIRQVMWDDQVARS